MREWLAQSAETSALAFLTTLHCALAMLLYHRSGRTARLTVLPSIGFLVLPWAMPAHAWLAIGLAMHVAWVVACERLLPPPAAAPPSVSPPPRGPQPKGVQPLPVLATLAETP